MLVVEALDAARRNTSQREVTYSLRMDRAQHPAGTR